MKLILCLIPIYLFSQDRAFKPVNQEGFEQRIALVIGNSKYASSPLQNPENDAVDITTALRDAKFIVQSYTNLSQSEMKKAISKFGESLNSNSIALFYYSGHGIQSSGKNYMIPIDAQINRELDIEIEAVDVSRVLVEMESARSNLNIVVLDACRDNPIPRSVRNTSKGLAQMNAPFGTMIAYSTSPGSVASDGVGRNGLYTSSLLKYLYVDSLRIEDVFKNVRAEVRRASGGAQITWESNSIEGNFYFNAKRGAQTVLAENDTKEIKRNSNKGFSLDDIESELQEKKAAEERIEREHQQKLQEMKDAFEKVKSILSDGNVSLEKKKIVKKRFVEYFAEDMPWTKEDDVMRFRFTNDFSEIEFVRVDGGDFLMGSNEHDYERPIHKQTVGDYDIAMSEITFNQYDFYCEIIGKEKPNDNGWGRGNRPVINVNWFDAQAYCQWLGEITNEVIRLPKEIEWEYAARGGKLSRSTQFSGSGDLNEVAWAKDNSSQKTHEARGKMPNELKIYDMSGNVYEWCIDEYWDYSQIKNKNEQAMKAYKDMRIIRGGSWASDQLNCRISYRNVFKTISMGSTIGFRVVRETK